VADQALDISLLKELTHDRPHSAINYQTPHEFAQRCLAAASAPLQPPPNNAQPSTQHQTETQPNLS
jgi:hypothetical protein